MNALVLVLCTNYVDYSVFSLLSINSHQYEPD